MSYRNRPLLAVAALLIASVAAASPARAADRLLWGNENVSSISFANLDGSGGGDLTSNTEFVTGLAIDSATGRLYYTNETGSINFLNLNGGGGGSLNTGSATIKNPDGLAIDPASRRIFWANNVPPGAISFANLDGSGGGDLNTSGATMEDPAGVAVDTASGRVYWSNYLGSTISFANADNSGGGGDLQTPGVSPAGPAGVAIDEGARTIYWSEYGGADIGHARLDGSGGDDLPTPGAPVAGAYGLSLDPAGGKVYWANNISSALEGANLDGSGGGPLSTAGASLDRPEFPILQKTPIGTGGPAISGGAAVKATLSCSQGSWAPDLFGALLYQAPQTFAYKWSREGAEISGATAETIKASKAGSYRCTVTGSNQAGSASQTSGPHQVGPPQPPDFNTALFDGKRLYVRLKCPARFTPMCLGNAAGTTVKQRCTRSHGRRHCKPAVPITAAVSAKQKPTKWKVAALKVKPKFRKTVANMAKHSKKKLLYVRQTIHGKRFKKGRRQAVFHIYRVRTIPR
jgi:DNA-binding beta-propeller fold protein YncE